MGLFSCFAPKSSQKYQQAEGGETFVKDVKGKQTAGAGAVLQTNEAEKKVPQAEAVPQDDSPDAVNPDASLITNMLDPEGPEAVARGKAYQVHFLGPPRPYEDDERVKTVHELGKIDEQNPKPQDPEIANILKLVASIFGAPAVLCALFDEKQVYVSEQHGEVVPCGHFPWRWTLCGWSLAFKSPQILVIPDTLKDARFANNMKVTVNPKIRFYCGAPLVARNGHRLGTLCFADIKPRTFDRSSCIMMNSFSELVVRQLEKDILLKAKAEENRALSNTSSQLQRTVDSLESCVVLLDTSKPGLEIVFTNAAYSKMTGQSRESAQGLTLGDLMVRMDGTQLPSDGDKLNMTMLQDFVVKEARLKKSSEAKSFTLAFRPASRQIMDENTVPFGVPSYLPLDGGESKAQRFYFMTIERFGQSQTRRSSTVGGSVLSALSSSSNSARSVSSGTTDVVDGLQLAHLLGRGSFGCVYVGKWYGTDVAVKVIDHDVPTLLGSDGAVKEANMAFKLRHPHIVATLKYVVKNVGAARSVATFDSSCSSPKFQGAKQAAADIHCGFSPRYLHEKPSSENSHSGGAGDAACWAVIQADAPIPEEAEEERAAVEEGHVSEDSMAMKNLCKVKEDGWRDLQSTDSHVMPSGAKTSADRNSGQTMVMEQPKQTWIIIEYCDRGSLQDAIDRGWLRKDVQMLNSPPNLTDVIATSKEIVSALQFMHGQDIVHGDLSAWNVMLTSLVKGNDSRGWVTKVADFGMSRALEAIAISTKTYGTITHMPPETLTQGIVSKAMDVYSFGVLLWQMYTGSRPYAGLRQAVVINNVCNKKQRMQWPQNTPPAYRKIADACMAYNQHERPTFADLVNELDNYVPEDPEWQPPSELYF